MLLLILTTTREVATKSKITGCKYWRDTLATFASNPSKGLSKGSGIQWPELRESRGQKATIPCYTRLRNGAPNF
ncbi:hypothetical protein QWA68_014680 [Fusarium oxysporum]|nr:hypothetical protein QWA68_014680 [Fusarium oxysporum]